MKTFFGVAAMVFGLLIMVIGLGNLAGFEIGPPMPDGNKGGHIPVIGIGIAMLVVGVKMAVLDKLNRNR